jgi:hypothetical protein
MVEGLVSANRGIGIGSRGGLPQAIRDHPTAGYEATKQPELGSGTPIMLRDHACTATSAGRLTVDEFEAGETGEYGADEPAHPASAPARTMLARANFIDTL